MERKQKKWWQRSLAFMLSLVLVISSFLAGGMPVSYAADGEINREVYVSDGGSDLGDGSRGNPFKTLTKAYEKVASGGTIYVSGKITLLHPFPKFDGKNVTITTAPEDKETAVIQRGAVGGIGTGTLFDLYNGHFILKKIIIDGSFGEDKSEGRIINLNINTILTIEEGTVLRNNFSKYPGSAVILNNASAVAEMTGGEIINNKHDSTGAVHINSSGAKFTMTGGKITGNSGGGVQVKDGEFNLSGNADITGNTIGNSERNVYLEGTKLLTLSGEFTGKAGITALNRMTAREQFGKANVGDLKGIENLIADNNPLLFAGYGENNALIWQELNVTITSPTGTVKNGKPTFTGTATPGATLTVKVGKNITLTAQADKDGNWSVTPETNIPDGAYTVEVSASIDDKISTPVTKEITVDTITSDGPAITTSPGDTVAVIVNNKIENGAVVVDAGVTLDSSVLNGYEDNLNGATVAIENFKAEDKLEYTNVNGITGNFNPATGILTLSGKASIEDYQAILRSVTFTTTSTDQTDRNITFTLGSALAFSENGHFYEYINKDAPITWFNAKKEAEEKNYFGRKGYLVTITGKNENNFVKEKTLGLGWIGAKDIERNVDNNPDGGTFPKQIGDWRWVTGPEGLIDQGKGLKFYTGYSPGKIEPDMYSNWQSGEPNDYNGIGEYVAHIFGPKESNPGQWNDYRPNDPSVKGYVIEYGGMPEDENFALSASKKIVFVEAPTVEIIKPEGDKITTSKPIFEGSVTKGSEVTVEIKDKAGNVIDTPTVTVNPDGTWSFEPTKDLPDGDYTVEVTAEKNGKTATETKAVTVDTTALTVGITEPIGDKVATAKPEFKGTATPGSTVTVAIKDKVGNVIDTPTVTVNPDGTWSFEPTKDLPDGDYTVEV
ncbi:Ig-like domain-containing protein, partial [Lysinibacillus sp.]|uniref:Ig-like domain-containing protein n=2 Tax=Lysinibacillus sp. TaxID=1869345 RepID=UPI00289BAD1D